MSRTSGRKCDRNPIASGIANASQSYPPAFRSQNDPPTRTRTQPDTGHLAEPTHPDLWSSAELTNSKSSATQTREPATIGLGRPSR